MRILAVAHNTFREAVRDKVLDVLLFFAAVAILGSKALGWIRPGYRTPLASRRRYIENIQNNR